MRNFIPELEVATLLPPQTCLIPKFGGLPWGLSLHLWPDCRECGRPMALLAQLPHMPPALDLGDPQWVLHLFQCTTAGCSTWSYDEGCNAAFVTPRGLLSEGLSHHPAFPSLDVHEERHSGEISSSSAKEFAMHGEIWIKGWREHEDEIPEHLHASYFDPDRFYKLPKELQFPHDFESCLATKAGGAPYWTANGPSGLPEIPGAPFEYLMQIDTHLCLRGPAPAPSLIGCDVYFFHGDSGMETHSVSEADRKENAPWSVMHEARLNDQYAVEFANFGSDGVAYVFINRSAPRPEVLLFWNR